MEIGSEFCFEKNSCHRGKNLLNDILFGKKSILLFSGRVAINLVVEDILCCKSVKTVYFPDYCCNSMIESFEKHDIKLILYKVSYNSDNDSFEYDIDPNIECDAFFAMNYFGYGCNSMDKYIRSFKARNILVIEDATHSLFSNNPFNENSDYIVASLRKWLGIYSGGVAIKRAGAFNERLTDSLVSPPKNIIEIKKNAMRLKKEYLEGNTAVSKKEFLEKYGEYNNFVSNLDSNMKMDTESQELIKCIDVSKIQQKRRRNAQILEKNISNKDVRVMFLSKNSDCPLFVPIYIKDAKREQLRKELITSQIYTPFHWPKPFSFVSNNLYDNELSLICDQRYEDSDMYKIIDVINGCGEI